MEADYGLLPPFSETAWQAEFAKYQTIPQYQELNRGMNLDAFKVIYWWEWSHRLLARLTGVVFLLPFLFFLWRGAIPANLRARLWVIFGAGAALGAVGWWMVSSGLTQGVSVSQYRLAFPSYARKRDLRGGLMDCPAIDNASPQ
jgi:heme a synthase